MLNNEQAHFINAADADLELSRALADSVINIADEAKSYKQECKQLKSETQRLKNLLDDQAFHTSSTFNLYKHPTRRIIDQTTDALEQILHLVSKCRSPLAGLPVFEFHKMTSRLEDCNANVSWLLDMGKSSYFGMPPIAAEQPALVLIWEQIALLYTGEVDDRLQAADTLALLAKEHRRCRELIVDEGGLGPLEKLRQEAGTLEGREKAAEALRCIAEG